MRVCIITPRYPPDWCGVGDYTALLAQHLAARGVEVTVLTSRYLLDQTDGSTGRARGQHNGVRVLPVMDGWGGKALPRLCSFVASGRYDVVHLQYQADMYHRSTALTAIPVALRALHPRLPILVTVHDYLTPHSRLLRKLPRLDEWYGKVWFGAMLLASSRVIVTNEQDEWRFLHRRWRHIVPASRYAKIPIGSNLPLVDRAPDTTRGQNSNVTVGYFGFAHPSKGIETLLDGFTYARRLRPNLALKLICSLGPDEPYERGLLRKIEELSLQDVVTVTGKLSPDDAATAIADCTVVALPFRTGVSWRHGTLLAALTLGRPVISTCPTPGAPIRLRDGRDIALVQPDDATALGRAIVDLADDPEKRAMLGRNGLEATQPRTWPAIAARTEEIYYQGL